MIGNFCYFSEKTLKLRQIGARKQTFSPRCFFTPTTQQQKTNKSALSHLRPVSQDLAVDGPREGDAEGVAHGGDHQPDDELGDGDDLDVSAPLVLTARR